MASSPCSRKHGEDAVRYLMDDMDRAVCETHFNFNTVPAL